MPLMGVAMLSLACGTWFGLLRLGWSLPLPWPDQLIAHGPLMIGGFLGTLISLERAVAFGSPWGYAAPALTAAGALVLAVPIGPVGPFLITAGSIALVVMFVALWRRQPSLFVLTMGLGAVAWAAGNGLWLSGSAIFRVVLWWLTFPVLTIAGERLELNRVLRPTLAIRAAFVAGIALLAVGIAGSLRWPFLGFRLAGAGLLALAAWLARYDVARRTVHLHGVTRYMAVSLLAGYAWLGFGGLVSLVTGAAEPGPVYDALLHAVFLGFVMSMVFAHAPVIVPAIIGRPLLYTPGFYMHVAVLHASLVLRMFGDLNDGLGRLRSWGGLLNPVAVGIFVINVGRSIRLARRSNQTARTERLSPDRIERIGSQS
jgi:hypothetical protein